MRVSEVVLFRKSIRFFLQQSITNFSIIELFTRASNCPIAKNENIYLY
jgi:hypothetical protein